MSRIASAPLQSPATRRAVSLVVGALIVISLAAAGQDIALSHPAASHPSLSAPIGAVQPASTPRHSPGPPELAPTAVPVSTPALLQTSRASAPASFAAKSEPTPVTATSLPSALKRAPTPHHSTPTGRPKPAPRLTRAASKKPSAPPSRVAAASSTPFVPVGGVTRSGSTLLLNGRPWRFTGVNDFGAATWYGTNFGCGSPTYDLDSLFNGLRPNSVVRFWAFQALGWNNKDSPQHIDFTGIDRVVAAAEADHQKLILTLSDQAGNCDDGVWHDQAWYDGGYTAPRPANTDGDLSYADWVTAIVTRYRNSPAVAFWEPVNEPQAANCTGATGGNCYNAANLNCPAGAAQSLVHFFTAISAQITSIDPNHLISEGEGGGGQCGIAGDDYATVASTPGIDLVTYHDYDGDGNYYPTGLQDRLRQAMQVGKPLIDEEVGVTGGYASGCPSFQQRADEINNKVQHAMAGGAVGFLPWWWSAAPGGCGDDFGPGEPVMGVLRNAPS